MENSFLPADMQQFHQLLLPAGTPQQFFANWQQELSLRQQLRAAVWSSLSLETREDFQFCKRALYYTHPDAFFRILIENLASLPWTELLPYQSELWQEEFFSALQKHFAAHMPNTKELKALILLYTPEQQEAYRQLCTVLSEKDLRLLLDKTSNFSLRSLLLDRIEHIESQPSKASFLLSLSATQKKQFACEGAQGVQTFLQGTASSVSLAEALQKLLYAGQIHTALQMVENLSILSSDLSGLHSFLCVLLPLVALYEHPETAFIFAEQQYHKFFPNEKNLPGAFAYLHFYHLARQHRSFPTLPFRREFFLRLRQIEALYPDDPLWECLREDFPQQVSEENARRLLEEAQKRLENTPHETFIFIELLYTAAFFSVVPYSLRFYEDLFAYVAALCSWLPLALPSPALLASLPIPDTHPLLAQIQALLPPFYPKEESHA